MRRSFFALLAFALLEASGGPVVWLGASASGGSVASLSVPREWLDRSRVAADLTAAGATLSNALAQVAGLAGAGRATISRPSRLASGTRSPAPPATRTASRRSCSGAFR